MPRKEPLWRRYIRFFGPDVNADVDDELAFHLEMRAQAFEQRGMSPAEARSAARGRFGDPERFRRSLRQQDGRRLRRQRWSERLGAVSQDVRYAFRMLARHRGFSAAVILTLGLGIGATTAMFSAVDAALLRPLPFEDPARLVELPDIQVPFAPRGEESPATLPDFRTMARQRELFSHVAAYAAGGLNLSGLGSPVRVKVGVVTADFFATLGRVPLKGRLFAPEEGTPDRDAVTIVSYSLWRRQLGGTDTLGQAVQLGGRTYRVVGVMPDGFGFPGDADLWIPLTIPMTFQTFRPFRGFIPTTVIARLAPGATVERGRDWLGGLWRKVPPTWTDHPEAIIANPVRPLQGSLAGDRRGPLLTLLGATTLLLLIAAVNVTNLLLAHAAVRDRELTVRAALGAGRGRLLRQLLAQSMVLALAGAAAGVVIAYATLGLTASMLPRTLAGLTTVRLDLRLLGFAVVLGMFTGVLFGLWPALRAARTDAQNALKSGHGQSAGMARGRSRKLLVTAEVALALMLLSGAGLMLKSFRVLLGKDTGFRTEHVGTLQVAFDPMIDKELSIEAQQRSVLQRLLTQLEGTPGLEAAGVVTDLPLSGQGGIGLGIQIEGRPVDSVPAEAFPRYIKASEGYFRTLSIPVLEGRLMRPGDDAQAPKVAVISATMAKLFWPGQSPVGKRFRNGGGDDERAWRTVIGVVADVRESVDIDPDPQMYYPIYESPPLLLSLVARSSLPTASLLGALRGAVQAVDPAQAVYNVRTLDDMLSTSLGPRRSNTTLISVFGALALVLAVVGVYGVVAYNVTLRSRELGIRAALGAARSDLFRLVLGEGIRMAVLGVLLGLGGTLLLSRLLRGLLYGVQPSDPTALAGAAVALAAPVLIAALVPARRAARADPVGVMRTE